MRVMRHGCEDRRLLQLGIDLLLEELWKNSYCAEEES